MKYELWEKELIKKLRRVGYSELEPWEQKWANQLRSERRRAQVRRAFEKNTGTKVRVTSEGKAEDAERLALAKYPRSGRKVPKRKCCRRKQRRLLTRKLRRVQNWLSIR